MSLIENMMTDCVIMNKQRVSDGEGGFTTTWSEGATIGIAIVCDESMNARVAEQQGVTSKYTLTTTKANALDYHDVVKRVSDGAIFRVTSNSSDKLSPAVSSLDIAQVTAERWTLA